MCGTRFAGQHRSYRSISVTLSSLSVPSAPSLHGTSHHHLIPHGLRCVHCV
uniref:Uncharacterized protein n=1 Tax=Anopheles dirus TaxID=7168 RepID=A0A182NVW7_9DIPT